MTHRARFLLSAAFLSLGSLGAWAQTAPADTAYGRFRIGGYGEMMASWKDYGLNRFYGGNGNTKKNRAEIAIPRFVLAGDYKITRKWILGAEIEFESGGTGQAVEMEATSGGENGEYETEIEKGGEVALEQFHLTRLIHPAVNVRFGHMVLPVGLTNTYHEPVNFLGVARPEGSTAILPSTWHETGVALFGAFGSKRACFDYEAMVTAGLNPNGFDVYNWVQGGSQGLFETDNFSAPAYTLRLNWRGVPGLRVGGSVFFNPNAGRNGDKLSTYDGLGKINILIYSLDAQYANKYVVARANYLSGNIPETVGITATNRTYSNKSPYSRLGPVARRAVDWSAEVGLNLKGFFPRLPHFPDIVPFAHYNYYNSQFAGEPGLTMDRRCEVSLWSVGLDYRILPNLIAKLDYTTRQIGTSKMFGTGRYNSENELRIGLSYALWFRK